MEKGFVGLNTLGRRQRLADANVTVTRIGPRWLDADSDNGLPAAGEVEGVRQDLVELLLLGNNMIGWEHRHDTRGGTRTDQRGAQSNRRAGVAANRLGDDILLRQLRQLFAHLGRLHLVGNDQDVFHRHQWEHAVNRLLQE